MTEQEKWIVMVNPNQRDDAGDYLREIVLTNGNIRLHCYGDLVGENEIQEIADMLNLQPPKS